jgi:hypothetical protein
MDIRDAGFRSKRALSRADYEVIMGAFPGAFESVDDLIEFAVAQQSKADHPTPMERVRKAKRDIDAQRRGVVYGGGRA